MIHAVGLRDVTARRPLLLGANLSVRWFRRDDDGLLVLWVRRSVFRDPRSGCRVLLKWVLRCTPTTSTAHYRQVLTRNASISCVRSGPIGRLAALDDIPAHL